MSLREQRLKQVQRCGNGQQERADQLDPVELHEVPR